MAIMAESAVRVTGRVNVGSGVLRVAGFGLLVALAAQVSIPVGPVPITLQTGAVVLAGLLLCPREAAGAMALYLGLGFLGLPVFAGGQAGLTGATFGYRAGFLVAAPLVSIVAGGGCGGLCRMAVAAALGTTVVFVCGVGWLAAYTGSLSTAVATGVLPFVVGEPLKIGAAVSAVCAVRGLKSRWIARGRL